MGADLKNQAMSASAWRLLQSLCVQGANLVVQVVLARLLLPADFGLIAMIWVLVAVTETFVTSGYGYALIQKTKATRVDECSIFYFNIVVSVIGCGLLWVSAPLVARFYGQPALILLTQVLSVRLVIGALGHVQLTLLTKRIDFKKQCAVEVASSVTSGVVGVTAAYLGCGVWSLVAQQLSRESARVALAWGYSPWRPAWLFSFQSLRSMFAFGSNMLFSGLLETIYQNIYAVIIGKFFSPADLGFYSRANRLQELPVQSVTATIAGVAFPVFAQVQEDKGRLRNGLRTCLGLLALSVFPVMTGLALCAKPLVALLLTDKWLPCVPLLQMLCLVGAMYPLYVLFSKILLALGNSALFFRLHVFQRILVVVSIIVTYRWGVTGLICGQIAGSFIFALLSAQVAGRLVEYRLRAQFADLLPYVVLSGAIGTSIWAMRWLRFAGDAWLLAGQLCAAAAVGILVSSLLRLPAFVLICTYLRARLSSRQAAEPVRV